MTKGLVGLVAITFLLLVVPAATAHGAAEPREIDTRVLADDDGLSGYGLCFEGQCVPGSSPQGWDIVVLEAREAALPTGEAVLILRTIYQAPDAQDGRSIQITFKAGGKDHTYGFEAAGAGVTSSTFDALVGPVDAFDGYPKAVDGYILQSKLGLKPGDQLTDVRVTSSFDSEPSDIAPGTWFLMGEQVPGAVEETPAGSYTLTGPAQLLEASPDVQALDINGTKAATITVRNPLNGTAQFSNATVLASDGIEATLDQGGLNLDAASTRNLVLTLDHATKDGTVAVVLSSDLGAYEVLNFTVKGLALETAAGHHGSTPAATATASHDESEDHHEEKGAPGVPAVLLALGLVVIVALRRR